MSTRLRCLYEEGRATGWVKAAWPFFVVLSFLYAAGVRAVRLFYQVPVGRSFRPRARVVSVGNIVMGGTGKTPLVRLVTEYLYRRDKHVAILLRGYKRPSAKKRGEVRDLHLLGDEGAWLKKVLSAKADVFAAVDRRGLARKVDALGRYDVFVLDDGFQHWRLKRDLDIVTVDATRGLSNGFMIPAGPLREEARALRRAGIVCLTRTDEVASSVSHALKMRCARLAPRAVLVECVVRPQGVTHVKTGAVADLGSLKGLKAGIFCGIGNPASFLRTVKGLGVDVVMHRFFEDHYAVSPQEIGDVAREAAARGAQMLYTTEKDAVRLEGVLPDGVDVWTVAVAVTLIAGKESFYERLDSLFIV